MIAHPETHAKTNGVVTSRKPETTAPTIIDKQPINRFKGRVIEIRAIAF